MNKPKYLEHVDDPTQFYTPDDRPDSHIIMYRRYTNASENLKAEMMAMLVSEDIEEVLDPDSDLVFRHRVLKEIVLALLTATPHPAFSDRTCIPFFNPNDPFGLVLHGPSKRLGRVFVGALFDPVYFHSCGYYYRLVQKRVDWEHNKEAFIDFLKQMTEAALTIGTEASGKDKAYPVSCTFQLSVIHEGSRIATMPIQMEVMVRTLRENQNVVELVYELSEGDGRTLHSAGRDAMPLEEFHSLAVVLPVLREFFANGWRTAIDRGVSDSC